MNALASTIEIGMHPATALLIGGGDSDSKGKVCVNRLSACTPIWSWVSGKLDLGGTSSIHLFGYEILGVVVDQQAKLFGYLFHIAALVAGIYSFHLRDPWQVSMSLFYAATAVGVAFAGDMLSLFLWWEGLAITSVFQIWGRKNQTG